MGYPPTPRLGVALLALWLAACGPATESKPPAGAGNAPPPPEVNVLTVAVGEVELTTDLPGRVQAVRSALVRARVEGVVQRVQFQEGSLVQQGAALFELDARTVTAAAEAARADLQAANQVLTRTQALLEARAVSTQEFEAAQARQKQASAALARAELDLENARVVAPISGRIGRALVTEGTLVGRGESTPLAAIDQLDPVYVNFTQPSRELQDLQRAMARGQLSGEVSTTAQLLLDDGSIYPLPGRVKLREQTVDPNTGAVFYRAEFPNPKQVLMPGSFVRVRIPQARMAQAVTVPQRAVMMNSAGPYVLVVGEEDKVAPVPIQTGAMSGDRWVVQSGLKPGMRVIVDGLQKARPGSVVRVAQAPAK